MSKCYIDYSGSKIWRNNEYKLHREDGPAYESFTGDKYWYINNNLHREDGPAVEANNGGKSWYHHGIQHRADGPAVEYADGDKYYYYYGQYIKCDSNEEYLKIIKLKVFW